MQKYIDFTIVLNLKKYLKQHYLNELVNCE